MPVQSRRNLRVTRGKKGTRKRTKRVTRTAKSSGGARKRSVTHKTHKTRSGKGKRNRKRRTRVRRGRGAACSRPRVDNDATPETAEAELMPEDLPLPPGAMRVPSINPNADLPSAIAAPAPPLTGEVVSANAPATTNDTMPTATTIPPATRSDKRPKRSSVKMIMDFPEYRVLRVSPLRQEIEDALANYVHHPNYQDPFGVHPRGVDNQLWQLVMGWYSEGGSDPDAVDQLLRALRSPRNAVIAF